MGTLVLWKLFKLIGKIAKAYPEATEFWGRFKRQYCLLRETHKRIVALHNLRDISSRLSKQMEEVVTKAEDSFRTLARKFKAVLSRAGYTWRIRWSICSSHVKKATGKMSYLDDELMVIERSAHMWVPKFRSTASLLTLIGATKLLKRSNGNDSGMPRKGSKMR